jgi:hypothetical protein
MKQNRFWLSLIGLCIVVACAAAIVLAIVSATTALAVTTSDEPPAAEAKADAAVRQRVLKGVVTDTSCSAKHVSEDKTAAECARTCVRHGAQYALVSGEKMYLLDGNLADVDQLAGQRAEVMGSVDGDLVIVRSIRLAE